MEAVTTAEARARMDRAFTMPQFVTSVAGYGGSARAKQVGPFVVVFCPASVGFDRIGKQRKG